MITVSAKKRETKTIGDINKLRLNGLIPGILYGGDKQNQKTNVKAYMTDWRMHEKPGFNELKEISIKSFS